MALEALTREAAVTHHAHDGVSCSTQASTQLNGTLENALGESPIAGHGKTIAASDRSEALRLCASGHVPKQNASSLVQSGAQGCRCIAVRLASSAHRMRELEVL